MGLAVALAEKQNQPLNQLTLDEFRSIEPRFAADVYKAFDLKSAMAQRRLTGSPGTHEVCKQLAKWKKVLK